MADEQYITVPLEGNTDDLVQQAVEFIQAQYPDWTPNEGSFAVWVIEAIADIVSDLYDLASTVPKAIFRYFGESVMNFPPDDGSKATGSMTVTAIDNAGYTVKQGDIFQIAATGDQLYDFEVVSDVVIDPGSTSTATGEVTLRALEVGSAYNDLTENPVPKDSLAFIASTTLESATEGGADAETDDEYLDRLSEELTLLTPAPIVPPDFSVIARRKVAGVYRAVTLDGYNPADDTYNNDKMVCIVAMDEDGVGVGSGIKAQIVLECESRRETNFIVNTDDPTVTAVDVTAEVHVLPGWDTDGVQQAVEDALNEYFASKNWGVPPGSVDSIGWYNQTVVRYLEVSEVINRVDGVDYIDPATFEVNGTQADVNLTGAVPLTEPGTMAVTAV